MTLIEDLEPKVDSIAWDDGDQERLYYDDVVRLIESKFSLV